MFEISLKDLNDNQYYTFKFETLEEIVQTYSLSQNDVFDFLKGYKVNPDNSDSIIQIISKPK